MRNISKELMGATAIPIVLSILKKGDCYGFAIVQYMKEVTNGQVILREASIYPVLKKLEKKGMVKSYWKLEGDERPRRYYKLLNSGEKQLEICKKEWEIFQSAFNILWDRAT
jgi:PadR family transcriptional regulator, regulatory protein PadR